jgi:hypothetical protein
MMDEHLSGRVLFKFFHFSVIVYNFQRMYELMTRKIAPHIKLHHLVFSLT